jgi:hypothetical protein
MAQVPAIPVSRIQYAQQGIDNKGFPFTAGKGQSIKKRSIRGSVETVPQGQAEKSDTDDHGKIAGKIPHGVARPSSIRQFSGKTHDGFCEDARVERQEIQRTKVYIMLF